MPKEAAATNTRDVFLRPDGPVRFVGGEGKDFATKSPLNPFDWKNPPSGIMKGDVRDA